MKGNKIMKSLIVSGAALVSAVGLLAVYPANVYGGGDDMEASRAPDAPKAVAAAGQTKELKFQTTCPVMGGAINKAVYVDHDGKRIYLCCKGCVDAVKKEPAKYIKALEDTGVTLAKVQTTCPVMGDAINKDLYVDHDGKRIYLCCKGCVGAVQKEPAKYIKLLEDSGVALDPAPQADKKADEVRPVKK